MGARGDREREGGGGENGEAYYFTVNETLGCVDTCPTSLVGVWAGLGL
jgi:hypothetical protein